MWRAVDPVRAMLTHPLTAKLGRRAPLTAEEGRVLEALLSPPRIHEAGSELVRQGDRPGFSTLLLSGLCGRVTTLADGGRQITQVSVAGDFLDLHSFTLKTMDHGVVALNRSEATTVAHEDLRLLTETQPHLARLLWLETTIDAAIHRQWIVSLGRRTGLAQMAHLFCETHARLHAAGQASETGFAFAITQADLADILGMSAVHANRLLQQLRQEGLIHWTGRDLTLLKPDRLRAIADFDPVYLRLDRIDV